MEKHILVILPHPDDEAFGISGTLAKHIQNGTQVTYACLTLGEMGRNMGIPPFANRVTLPEIRKKELEESCEAIGIQDLRMLGFHDKTIEFEDQVLLDGQIDALLKELKPSLIITFYPGYSVHPDHDATGAAVIRTVARLPKEERPPVHCIAFANNIVEIGEPKVINDVRDFLKHKMASIQAHRSQFQAAELLGSKPLNDKEIQARFGTEHFWIYPFE
ncbi:MULTISPECIES: bacillithiol biosynthesis deacetylase BshB2 [Paenibacillus]|uniref:Bacillithiol biosynthesis deacetylase BshB2 n=1 Tax=Paenibacillus odorifer TaxID=189426 RepID=A0A1R0WPE2_9BACL|nr:MULTISPECIES: bacillithiol biosynthesis deacetylase BshB2 [Paenibacillus]AIQ72459.1 deacetylase [Paenibacillus odorifer]AWV36555.1 bacillithiol biosynthesis deacetylase BshB2 [Paenibacillus odorifer]MEC0134401.1 bacillithiol biosynthesis deacetylase BshB2 [Paenibacillus odorifer]MEC0222873.1 bacillithiol biosynthesis deacetylase BshB2 [Paenibacillus odorifer]OMC63651.1 bacillithiol biosynthesis deacetylase BshB2 [Paenibacillus odorifer]